MPLFKTRSEQDKKIAILAVCSLIAIIEIVIFKDLAYLKLKSAMLIRMAVLYLTI